METALQFLKNGTWHKELLDLNRSKIHDKSNRFLCTAWMRNKSFRFFLS